MSTDNYDPNETYIVTGKRTLEQFAAKVREKPQLDVVSAWRSVGGWTEAMDNEMEQHTTDEFARQVHEMLAKAGYKAEPTGRIYSFSSTEYKVTKPDGTTETVWTPPWGEFDDLDLRKPTLAMLALALGVVKKAEK